MSDYHLICVNPFGKYTKGQLITDPDEVNELLPDREHHFIRIAIPSAPVAFTGPADEPPSALALELAPEVMKPKAK